MDRSRPPPRLAPALVALLAAASPPTLAAEPPDEYLALPRARVEGGARAGWWLQPARPTPLGFTLWRRDGAVILGGGPSGGELRRLRVSPPPGGAPRPAFRLEVAATGAGALRAVWTPWHPELVPRAPARWLRGVPPGNPVAGLPLRLRDPLRALAPDASTLVTRGWSLRLRRLRGDGSVGPPTVLPGVGEAVAYSPDGATLAVLEEKRLRVLRVRDLRILADHSADPGERFREVLLGAGPPGGAPTVVLRAERVGPRVKDAGREQVQAWKVGHPRPGAARVRRGRFDLLTLAGDSSRVAAYTCGRVRRQDVRERCLDRAVEVWDGAGRPLLRRPPRRLRPRGLALAGAGGAALWILHSPENPEKAEVMARWQLP